MKLSSYIFFICFFLSQVSFSQSIFNGIWEAKIYNESQDNFCHIQFELNEDESGAISGSIIDFYRGGVKLDQSGTITGGTYQKKLAFTINLTTRKCGEVQLRFHGYISKYNYLLGRVFNLSDEAKDCSDGLSSELLKGYLMGNNKAVINEFPQKDFLKANSEEKDDNDKPDKVVDLKFNSLHGWNAKNCEPKLIAGRKKKMVAIKPKSKKKAAILESDPFILTSKMNSNSSHMNSYVNAESINSGRVKVSLVLVDSGEEHTLYEYKASEIDNFISGRNKKKKKPRWSLDNPDRIPFKKAPRFRTKNYLGQKAKIRIYYKANSILEKPYLLINQFTIR